MDQLIYASLSHTYYWYEVGMLKVPTVFLVCFGGGALFYMWGQLEKLEVCAAALLCVQVHVSSAIERTQFMFV